MSLVSEEDVERALVYLAEKADDAAEAKATRIYLEEYRKSLKAMLMKEHGNLPVNAQERDAYASMDYVRHLDALKEAVKNDEKHRFLREAAEAKIEVWRTQQADTRRSNV